MTAPERASDDLRDLARRHRDGGVPPLLGPHAYDPATARGYRAAAVVALFTPRAGSGTGGAGGTGGTDLFLVQRSEVVRHHPGQVALPGGAIEPAEDAPRAAVRELEEETGLDGRRVEVLGSLDPVLVPVSRYAVTPVLAWSDDVGRPARVVPGEVLHTLRVDVAALLDPAHRAVIRVGGHRTAGFALPGAPTTGAERPVWVWGFTGNLLEHLFTQLGWLRGPAERELGFGYDLVTGRLLAETPPAGGDRPARGR